MHIEQDSGKSHPLLSLVDYNRAGVGLLEIVSLPEISSSQEAATYVLKIQRLLQHAAASEALLELGTMRCDVNVSVVRRRAGEEVLSGARCEIKNINSPKYLARVVEFEIQWKVAAGGSL